MNACAILCSYMVPLDIENVLRKVSSLLGKSGTPLRISDNSSEIQYEKVYKLYNNVGIRVYRSKDNKDWAVKKAESLYGGGVFPNEFKVRTATYLSTIFGVTGKDPVSMLIVYADPARVCPQIFATTESIKSNIPSFNIADKSSLNTIVNWANTIATK